MIHREESLFCVMVVDLHGAVAVLDFGVCFVAEIKVVNGIASIGKDCKACGRCLEVCRNDAIRIHFGAEDILFNTLMDRIQVHTNIASGS